MNSLDFLVIASMIVSFIGGVQVGLFSKAFSWAGTLFGFIGSLLLLPIATSAVSGASASTRLSLGVVLVLSGVIFGQMIGLALSQRFRWIIANGAVKVLDRIAGGIAAMGLIVFSLWLVIPVLAKLPGWPAHQTRSSVIVHKTEYYLPERPSWAMSLVSTLSDSQFPEVFGMLSASPDAGELPDSVSLSPSTIENVKNATFRIEGEACRRIQDGTGFVVGRGLIVTNAHVVAGENRTSVISEDGQSFPATVIGFDAKRDLALLRAPRVTAAPLKIGNSQTGDVGAIFGYPGGQHTIRIAPASISKSIVAKGRDLYDQVDSRRDVLVLASDLAQGDSGAALVNNSGEVIGVAFALAPDRPGTAYALNVTELQEFLSQPHVSEVDTRDCLLG